MHLNRVSRHTVISFCIEKVFHYLLIEFNCDENELEKNIHDTLAFYQGPQNTKTDWLQNCRENMEKYSSCFETCSQIWENPLITVQSSENPAIHSVTARGVKGLLQTSILGVLSSPVKRNQLYFFSRHGESEYNILGRIGGNADLSSRGKCYAESLTKYFTKTEGVTNPKMVIS